MLKYLVIPMLMVLPMSAMASSNHHNTTTQQITNIYNNKGIAISGAIAHASQCDSSTYSLQGSAGFSTYMGRQAEAFGLCKRFKKVMGSVSIAYEDGTKDPMVSIGIHWRF